MMKSYQLNSYLFGANAPYVEELYESYLDNPAPFPINGEATLISFRFCRRPMAPNQAEILPTRRLWNRSPSARRRMLSYRGSLSETFRLRVNKSMSSPSLRPTDS